MKNTSTQPLSVNIDKNTTRSVSHLIQVKVNKMKKSAAGQLSARPSRSFIKSKSLIKPTISKLQKSFPSSAQ